MDRSFRLIVVLALMLTWTAPASAYIGPGMGVGAAAAVLGVFAGVVLLVVGLVWYPLRRMIRRVLRRKP